MGKHLFSTLVFAAILAAFFMPAASSADLSPVGTITEAVSPASVERADGSSVGAAAGLELMPGDTIFAGPGGSVRFTLKDSSRFMLTGEAELSIDELSFEEEEQPAVLSLALGYLWSKIAKVAGLSGISVHTPTTVCGVRGTEFDTVVSLDSATAVAVDEGVVAVETGSGEVNLKKGEMSEIEADERIGPVGPAAPRSRRDWQAWMKRREENLVQRMPELSAIMRKHFETAVEKTVRFDGMIKEASFALDSCIAELKQAIRQKSGKRTKAAREKLKKAFKRFAGFVGPFRRGANRILVMERASRRMERFVAENRDRFGASELGVVEENLQAIARKRDQLKSVMRQSVLDIRRMFGKARALSGHMK